MWIFHHPHLQILQFQLTYLASAQKALRPWTAQTAHQMAHWTAHWTAQQAVHQQVLPIQKMKLWIPFLQAAPKQVRI